MTAASLESLPNDLIIDILEHLDTARDVARFEATSRRARSLIHQTGWRCFVKTRFPSLNIPSVVSTGWNAMANRLTYLDRCWDRRGLYATWYCEKYEGRGRRGFRGQSVSFQSVVDAHVLSSSQEELLAFGAGENLILGRRTPGREHQDVWCKLQGREMGYAAGSGDVTAVTIIQRHASPEAVVGRATGDLQLLSAIDDAFMWEASSQSLATLDEAEAGIQKQPTRKSPGQMAISWTAWQPQARMLASCRSSVLTLHNLGDTEETTLRPVMYYDVSRDSASGETSLIRNASFMSADVIACGLGGCREPLRWGQIRPTGLEFFNAAEHSQISRDMELGMTGGPNAKMTTVRAIAPVCGMNPSLLLSAWDDGSHRLSDLRTPSHHDALYRDQFQPYQGSSSLLVYGSERFVAGNNVSPDIRFFDFRFPKSYHHSSAMPCSPELPVPSRPHDGGDASLQQSIQELALRPAVEKCDPMRGRLCTWHDRSKQDSWRPDAVFNMGNPELDRVHSLAKASDLSASFYCGFRGTVVEMTYGLGEDAGDMTDHRTSPPGWRASEPRGRLSMMEVGVGLCDDGAGGEGNGILPELFYHDGYGPCYDSREQGGQSRLSRAWRCDYGMHW